MLPSSPPFNRHTLPALLHQRATHTPRDVAYQFPELKQAVTWAQLWQDVQTMAAGLAQQGIGPGHRVAVLLEGRLELLVTLLGTVAIGAVAVPLNTYSKLAELRQYLLAARPAALVLGTSGLRVAWPELTTAVLPTPEAAPTEAAWVPNRVFVQGAGSELPLPFRPYEQLVATQPSPAEARALCTATPASAPAFLLYTSGTTGLPKGVLRSTASFLAADAGAPGRFTARLLRFSDQLTRRFGLLCLLPLYHQGGIGTLVSVLKACNVPTTLLTHFNPVTALEMAERERCKFLIGTPYMVQAMLGAGAGRPLRLKALVGIAFASAAVSGPLLEGIVARLPGLYFFTVSYGSSEAGAVANGTCFFANNKNLLVAGFLKLMRRANLLSGEVPYALFLETPYSVCGRVDKAVEVQALDTHTGQFLPPGQAGELVVRSHRVMPYAEADPATDNRLPDGWYRTGDVGYVTPAGVLILTDRLKRLISRGGEKISPTEVENALRQHPAVADAYVLGVADALYGEQVCAVVVPQAGATLNAAELRARLGEQLSQFKLPKYVVALPALPLLGSGKPASEEIRQEVMQRIATEAYA